MSINTQTIQAVVVLNNLRSAHNVGSVLRTADCAGVSKVYLVGTTPQPIDRFGRTVEPIRKVSLGAEDYMDWKYFKTMGPVISRLRKDGFNIIAVEQDERAMDYRKLKFNKNHAFIFGSETTGLPGKILDKCDAVIEIPMYGRKESLNVAVSAGIVLFSKN